MAASPLNVESILASLPSTQSPQDFQQQLDALPLPKPVKAQLWDARFTPTPSADRFTEAPGVPPSVEAPVSVSAAPTDDTAPAPKTPMDLPVRPVKLPQPATTIGPLPPLTGPTAVDPPTPKPTLGPQVAVPMASTPALNTNASTNSDLYQRVAEIARNNPSFGQRKIKRETGAAQSDIDAALERHVNDGTIRRTQNARRSVVYHAL